MSVTTKIEDGVGEATPPSKKRVLIYAAAPVALLILLMLGVRFATESAQKMEAAADARNREALQNMRPSDPKMRPTPIPSITVDADKATQVALETVVRGQLQAIGEQDFEKALTFATPEIRKNAQPQQFGAMIRAGYSPMLAAKRITVLPGKIQGKPGSKQQAFVATEIVTRSGDRARYGYILIGGGNEWQVGGVVPDRNAMMGQQENRVPMPRQESLENFRDL